jgi:replicative DNA helicase
VSYGKLFLSSVIKSGNKNYLNRVKDELFNDRDRTKDSSATELDWLNFIRRHVMEFRTLPSASVLRSENFEYIETDQPPEYYLEQLVKRAVWNSYKGFAKNMEPLVKHQFDLQRATELITEFSKDVARLSVADKYKSLTELGREIQAQIESRKQGNSEVFIPFGWPTIDRLTGGVTGGDLVYIVARPGVGKSQLLSYCSYNAYKNGFSPLVLTMEMTDVQLARRIYGVAGEFNHDSIRRDIPDSEVERRLSEAVNSFEQNQLQFNVICGQVRQTVENVATLIDELKPDVVYIDAAYLLNLKNSNAKAWEKIALVGEKLKEIAISRNVPIIQTVQFNRDALKNKRFQMDTIAGSDAIGQLGSVILAVQPGQEPYEETRRQLEIIKNREGGLAEIEINYLFDPPNFTEVEYIQSEDTELKI